jgi:hypothetical protein
VALLVLLVVLVSLVLNLEFDDGVSVASVDVEEEEEDEEEEDDDDELDSKEDDVVFMAKLDWEYVELLIVVVIAEEFEYDAVTEL